MMLTIKEAVAKRYVNPRVLLNGLFCERSIREI